MALETVIGHDAAKIRVAGKEDTKEIVDLTLIPVGSIVQAGNTGDGGSFISVRLDSDAGVVADREQVVDDFKALVSGWVIGGSDGAELRELGSSVIYGALEV